jgi:hypothetical protein
VAKSLPSRVSLAIAALPRERVCSIEISPRSARTARLRLAAALSTSAASESSLKQRLMTSICDGWIAALAEKPSRRAASASRRRASWPPIRLDSTFEPIFSTATSAARQKSVRRPRRRARSRRFRKEIHRGDGSRRRRFASGRSMPPAWPAQRVRMSQPAFCFEFDWRSRPAIPQRRLADTTQRKARCTIAEAKC